VVFQAAVEAGLFWIAVIGILGSVVGAFYYLKVIKVMYFDAPASKALGRSDWVHQAILALCVLVISPLGYLLTKCLGAFATTAVAAILPGV
jgi:NADH-quinone oxidoreductase subunit N